FGEGVTSVTVTVAGGGTVDVTAAPASGGAPATATLSPAAPTSGPYDHTTLTAPFTASGVRDVRVTLRGEIRLAELRFTG
ncbi:hypothetical protein, partial [Streptomyces sp. UH6]|uniref:hypothetical protein n=1 Tax=Streptomyces sp. UH6 TaxID=2748379 RepID=UPI0015D52041